MDHTRSDLNERAERIARAVPPDSQLTPQCRNCQHRDAQPACGGLLSCRERGAGWSHRYLVQPDHVCDRWWPRQVGEIQVMQHTVSDGALFIWAFRSSVEVNMWVSLDGHKLQIETQDPATGLTRFRRIENAGMNEPRRRLWWIQFAAVWADRVRHRTRGGVQACPR